MSSPRHLWSGDWEQDSAAVTEELATRRAQTGEPVETPPEVAPARARPRAAARVIAWLRAVRGHLRRPWPAAWGRQELTGAVLVALLVLVTAGTAFGVTLLVTGSGGSSGANKVRAWLGIQVAGSPIGIVITDVAPGSPAAKAGLDAGDTISAIDNQPIGTVDGVSAALAGVHAGATIQIQFTRGLATYTTQARLAAHPPGYP